MDTHSPPPGMTIQSQSYWWACSIGISAVMRKPPTMPHVRDGSSTAASTTMAPNFCKVVANKTTSVSSLPVAMGIKTCFCDERDFFLVFALVFALALVEGCVVVMMVLYCIVLYCYTIATASPRRDRLTAGTTTAARTNPQYDTSWYPNPNPPAFLTAFLTDGGNQRLKFSRERGVCRASCVVRLGLKGGTKEVRMDDDVLRYCAPHFF